VWHRDHRIIGQVVLDAAFPFARDHLAYPKMLAEGLLPHKVQELLFFGAEDVNHHVDITTVFEDKLEALQCHESQIAEFKIDDLDSWLRKRCKKAASGSAYQLAEAFHRVEMPA
jgi:LmbE family N-acetylglucosaminyl deacetylase